MPRGIRYTPEQIIGKLREAQLEIAKGLTASQAAKEIEITDQFRNRISVGQDTDGLPQSVIGFVPRTDA